MYGALLEQPVLGLPDGVRTRVGRVLILDPAVAQTLREAAAEVLLVP